MTSQKAKLRMQGLQSIQTKVQCSRSWLDSNTGDAQTAGDDPRESTLQMNNFTTI